MSAYPQKRLRRMRTNTGIRRLVAHADPLFQNMIWPVFVVDGENVEIPIDAMPGQSRMSADVLCSSLEPLVAGGLGGVLIFGVPPDDVKTEDGVAATTPDGIVPTVIRRVKESFPALPVFSDVCLCGYTSHGHCGPLRHGSVDNDAALPLLADAALAHAEAGADGVAPSAMMDGQVKAIRQGLDASGLTDTIIMSYAVKFASACYGPFREAAGSAPQHGDRLGYQLSSDRLSEALEEARQDEHEGADILMVKPATFYLDIIAAVREQSNLPLAAYNVSGEYAMLHASATAGYGDLYALVRENLQAISRSGAEILITYWANQYETIYGKQ